MTIVPDKPLVIVLRGMDRVDALMAAYNEWRRAGDEPLRGSSQSWLGRLVKQAKRAAREETLPPSTMPRHDDQLMAHVGRVIHQMPEQARACMVEHYCGPSWWPVWDPIKPNRSKAGRCGVSRATYYRRVAEGKAFVDWVVPWDGITLVYAVEHSRRLREELLEACGSP